jgi:hypothetical protein
LHVVQLRPRDDAPLAVGQKPLDDRTRIWRKFQLKPHLTDTFKLSTDPLWTALIGG